MVIWSPLYSSSTVDALPRFVLYDALVDQAN